MNDAQFEQQLRRQIDELPRDIRPARDLWQGIDHAIEQQQGVRRFNVTKLSGIAAGVAVLGLTAVLTFNSGTDRQPGGAEPQYVASMTETFEQQKQALLVKYKDNRPSADNWQAQLKELDDAATAIKKALQQDPANAQLIRMLQQVYQQQLDLIKAVNASPWQAI